MGDKVGRSTLFGIPLQQTWAYGNTGDFAPWYYTQTDAPLYYYSFTDAYIAMQYRSLHEGRAGALRSDDHGLQPRGHVRRRSHQARAEDLPGRLLGHRRVHGAQGVRLAEGGGRDGEPHEPGARSHLRLHRRRPAWWPSSTTTWTCRSRSRVRTPIRSCSSTSCSSAIRSPRSSGRTAGSAASFGRSTIRSSLVERALNNPELSPRLHRHLLGRGREVHRRDAREHPGGRRRHQPASGSLPLRHRRGRADRAGEIPQGLRHVRAALREAHPRGEREAA